MLFLDTAAGAPVHPEVLRALWPYLAEEQGNPSSVHTTGRRAREAVEWARATVAAALEARPADLVFTSGGTEANNLAIKGIALARPRGGHIITTAVEHPSVLESCRYLERFHGFRTTLVPVDAVGRVDPATVALALRESPEATLVSVGLANNEVGTVQPVAAISALARAAGVPCHTDAVQAFGAIPVSVRELGVDALSLSGHKLGAPQGVGVLVVRRGLHSEPLIHGGGQEGGARSGTQNVAGIVGLGAAVQRATPTLAERAALLAARRDAFIADVRQRLPDARLTGDPVNRLPGHTSWCFPGVSGESVLVGLDAAGIECSSGSACAAGRTDPSPVLRAMGVPAELASSAVRLTWNESVGEADLARVVEALVKILGFSLR
ncbi:cysteine desulfurase family protein [Klugiella xanthotipulae]